MNTVSLDVHRDASQLHAVTEHGELILEMKVATEMKLLRSAVAMVPGPKRVVFEEGPLSGLLYDALGGVADEVISCDPTHNALIARDENATDESDAQNLGMLTRLGRIRRVYVPPEPYRTLRSLLAHDRGLSQSITGVKNRMKALCRRQGIRCHGAGVYRAAGRPEVLRACITAGMRGQMKSLYRQLDHLRRERVNAHRTKAEVAQGLPVIGRILTIPGVGPILAQTAVAWVVDPNRFGSRSKLSAYVGLGLGQGFTDWKPVGKAKASKRGQRQVKRVLILGAMAAISGDNALARRYRARREAGWEHGKAIRDVAREMLWVMCAIWRTEKDYDDSLVSVPQTGKW